MGRTDRSLAGAGDPTSGWGSPARAGLPGIVAAVAVRPHLWSTAWRQARALARPRWWRRWPPVPGPEPEYVKFRLQTAYGDDGGRLPAADVVAFLEWCRRIRALRP
jgi:hypothetical protein